MTKKKLLRIIKTDAMWNNEKERVIDIWHFVSTF